MGEIIVTLLIIGLLIIGVIYLIMHFALKQLEKTFTGRIIIGAVALVAGIFLLILADPIAGIVVIVIATIYLLLEIFIGKKKQALNQ